MKKNGEVEGVKIELLDYSNRTIKSIKAYQELTKIHFKYLKQKYKNIENHDWIKKFNIHKIYRSDVLVEQKFFR